MAKILELNKTIYELCSNDENIMEILANLGFKDITKPGMINTMGKFMTIPKGAKVKKIDLETIKDEFICNGYEIKE